MKTECRIEALFHEENYTLTKIQLHRKTYRLSLNTAICTENKEKRRNYQFIDNNQNKSLVKVIKKGGVNAKYITFSPTLKCKYKQINK